MKKIKWFIGRKKTEEELKKFQFMVESAHDAIFFKDLESRYIIANKKTLDVFGLSRREVIGKNDLEIMPNKEEAMKNIEDDRVVFKTGKPTKITKHMTGADGKKYWFEALKMPHFDNDKNIIGLVGIARNITERKKAEEELRFKTTLLEVQSEASIDGILVVDSEGKSILFNRQFGQMWKLPQHLLKTRDDERMLQYAVTQLKYPDKFLEKVKYLYTHRDEKSKDEIEFKDGRTFDRYSSPLVDSNGKYYGRIWYFRDITERKKAAEALRQSESKHKTLLENLPQKIFLKDRNSVYIFCNENYARDLKIKSGEIAGKTDYEFYPKELAEKYRRDDKRLMESEKSENIEEKYIQDGQEVIVHTVKTPVRDKEGNVFGILGIFWDITEEKRRQEELEKTREQLIQAGKMASTGQLAAGVAHELNNPLTSILGFAQLLLKQMDKKDPGFKSVKTIVEETKRCKSIIQNLLSFSRQSQKKDLKLLDINLPLRPTLGLVREQMKFRDIELIENLAPNLPLIKANPNHLQQVFMNLIINAQDAMPQGGRLYIKTRMVKGSEKVEVIFRDTGSGIPEKHLGKLFNPFFTTKRPGRGVGLGLSVSYGIIKEHEGRIEVESKVGEGSTFTITLPTDKEL